MNIDELIGQLEQANTGDAHLDQAICDIMRKHFPGQRIDGYSYTASLDAALYLAQLVAPRHVGGASWEDDGTGTATINDGPFLRCATPAIALCLAALKLFRSLSEASASATSPIKGPWRIAKMVNRTGSLLRYRLRKLGTNAPMRVIELEADTVFSHGIREPGTFEIVARAGNRTITREITFSEDEHAKVVVLE